MPMFSEAAIQKLVDHAIDPDKDEKKSILTAVVGNLTQGVVDNKINAVKNKDGGVTEIMESVIELEKAHPKGKRSASAAKLIKMRTEMAEELKAISV